MDQLFRTAVVAGLLLGSSPSLTPANVGEYAGADRGVPVHRIGLRDEIGADIVPHANSPMPFSARKTCGVCHDYRKIHNGWHFNAGRPLIDDGRRGEPWVWVDEKTGTQLPLSDRDWKGTWKPDEVGLPPWQFTKEFGRHMAGGGVSEPEGAGNVKQRWQVTGELEINCLGCHNASPLQDQSEWAKQIGRENLRWAATAASGMAEVDGMAARMPDTWDIYDGPNPDDQEYAVPPCVSYHSPLFDSKNRLFFDIALKPHDRRCQHCHSASHPGASHINTDVDVHSTAGMSCVDCHRNSLEHKIMRGDEEGTLSCEGCHTNGRMGAPVPRHKGLPPVHLEKMSCTSCHSGPAPESRPVRVITSRANRLGIHGRAQWATDLPSMIEPVFVRGEEGQIEPHRMMWPSFWARRDGDTLTPLAPSLVSKTAGHILDSQGQAGRILQALSQDVDAEGAPVLSAGGVIYRVNLDSGLDIVDYKGAIPPDGTAWARITEERLLPLLDALVGKEVPQPAAQLPERKVLTLTDVEQRQVLDALQVPISDAQKTIGEVLAALAWYDDPQLERVLSYGSRMYFLSNEGTLQSTNKPGPRALYMTWGWRNPDSAVSLAPEAHPQPGIEELGIPGSISTQQVSAVLKELTDVNLNSSRPIMGMPVYVSSGKVYGLSKDVGLALIPVSALPSNIRTHWAWLDQVRTVPIVPDEQYSIAVMLRNLQVLSEEGEVPVCIYRQVIYRVAPQKYITVPKKEALAIKEAASEATETLEKAKAAKSIASDNNKKFYRIGSYAKSISRSDPDVAELLALAEVANRAEEKAKLIMGFGDHYYRAATDEVSGLVSEELPSEQIDLSPMPKIDPNWPVIGRMTDNTVHPLISDFAVRAIVDTAGKDAVFTEEQVALAIKAIENAGNGKAVYVASGKLFNIDDSGKLVASDNESAEPYSWPIGHDVRPATKSLGAKGCTECHAKDSPFLFADVRATGPMKTDAGSVKSMHEHEQLDDNLHALLGLAFKMRGAISVFLLALVAIVAGILLVYTLRGLNCITKHFGRLPEEKEGKV